MRKELLSTLLLSVFSGYLYAQVQGTVRNVQGEPLPGAYVRWQEDKVGVVTDGTGRFHLDSRGNNKYIIASCIGFGKDTIAVSAPTDSLVIILWDMKELSEATVVAKRTGTYKSFSSIENVDMVTSAELCRAACCNLGEAFVANPSVDVSYSDAATGARQIRLLGLSGTYVQMLTENIPNFRVAASPYGLGYVPGPWMQSIQVSKGISSVKNGYEALTGQINVEYKKPQQSDADLLAVNLFGDSGGKIEANADATFKMPHQWSSTLLAHYEKETRMHDGNGDGFADVPQVEQFNAMNRWAYIGEHYVFQAGVKALREQRNSGQTDHGNHAAQENPYKISIGTDRYEAFAKNAYIFNHEHNSNVALILSGSWHRQDAEYGLRLYDVKQSNAYASLLFETELTKMHSLSTGLSFNYDGFSRRFRLEHDKSLPLRHTDSHETVPGAYAQYTYNLNDKLLFMGGVRADHSNLFGLFVTPRAHIKFTPSVYMNFRLSAGKGYRASHVLDENNYLLSGSRKIVAEVDVMREEAWNYGASAAFKIPLAGKMLNLNLEYYYTDFLKQAVADMDSDPHAVIFAPLSGRSYSSVVQAEASYPVFSGFTATVAYRFTDARTTYGGRLLEKPLTSRYKALLTASYKTPLEIWQFDATLQLNGGGRMPEPYRLMDGSFSWSHRYPAFPQLSAQITRYFRRGSIYIGGENLTNFKQKNPIIAAADPWGDRFDPTMLYGPVHGIKAYVGVRFNLERK